MSTVKNKTMRSKKRKTTTNITPYVMVLKVTSEPFEKKVVNDIKINNQMVSEFYGTHTPGKIRQNINLSMLVSFFYTCK